MKLLFVGAILLLISAASLADTPPGGVAPPATSGTTSAPKAPSDSGGAQHPAQAKATGNSCRKAAVGTCKGCAITCGEGEKPSCGDALYNWNSNKCIRDASCRCKARRS